MTHKYAIGEELDFEDHRWQHSRALRVVVHEHIGAPPDTYTVKPWPGHINSPKIVAHEDELSRPREETRLRTQ